MRWKSPMHPPGCKARWQQIFAEKSADDLPAKGSLFLHGTENVKGPDRMSATADRGPRNDAKNYFLDSPNRCIYKKEQFCDRSFFYSIILT